LPAAPTEADTVASGPLTAADHGGLGSILLRVSSLTLLTQVISFVSSILIARTLGATRSTDAYFLGYSVPLFVSSVFLTAIRSGAIPALTDEASRSERAFLAGSSELVSITLISTLLLSLLAAACAVALLPLTAGSPSLVAQAQVNALALTPLGVCAAMVSALAAILAVINRFAAAALVVGIDPILRIVLLALFGSALGTKALVIANDGGNALAVLVMWALVLRHGIPLKLRWPMRSDFVRRSIALTAPLVLCSAVVATNPVIDRAMTAPLGAGSITALDLGIRLFGIPLTLLGATLVGPLTATWSARKAAGGWAALRDSVNRGIEMFTVVVPPLLVLGIVLRHQLVSLIYHGGGYSEHATNQSAAVLGISELGAPAMLVGIAFGTLFVIEGHAKFVLMTGVINFALNGILDYVLRTPLGVAGIALSTSMTYTVVLVIYATATRRRWEGVRTPFSGPTGVRTFLAAGAMSVVTIALASAFSAEADRIELLAEVVVVSLAGLASYLAVVLRRDQWRRLITASLRQLTRLGWPGPLPGQVER